MAKRIVLAGDSFGCEWPIGEGWSLMLAKNAVNNIAQAGVGEYKILKQLWNECRDAYWVNNYDAVIVCHTSPKQNTHNRTSCSQRRITQRL